MTIIAASLSPASSALLVRSATSTFPLSSQLTTTTDMPAITALAAFVP